MSHKRLLIVAAIIAAIVFAGFILSVPHTTRDVEKALLQKSETSNTPNISIHDSFKKGMHTITGSVTAPNVCTAVTAQASPVGDALHPNGILIVFSMQRDLGVCLQVPTDVSFKVTMSAPAGLPITATVNGIAATTTTL